jgi:CMP-N-acetylneuraminic acid synthetase
LFGKPLILYTIEQALDFKMIDRVVVSTDSKELAEIARKSGSEVPFMRPQYLAADEAPKLPAIQHAVRYYFEELNYKPDYVIDMDPTSPLRIKEDIEKCMDLIMNDPNCDSIITGYRSNKNPYFNMVEIDSEDFARLSKKPQQQIAGRQGAPPVFAMNASIYAWKTPVLLNQSDLFSGKVKFVEMPEERSIDIDTEIDFKLVEIIMLERQKT